MNLDDALNTFIEEAAELLLAMEQALLHIESNGHDSEAVNTIFRAAHTIKGSAGLFGLDSVVSFTHVAESVLDRVRSGQLDMDAPLTSLLLECRDYMGALIAAATGQSSEPPAAAHAHLMASLSAYLDNHAAAPRAENKSASANVSQHWHIALQPAPDVLRNGMDPLTFIRYLDRLGTVTQVRALTERLPDAEALDPETCYLGFDIELESSADQTTLADAFEFIREGSDILIEPFTAQPTPAKNRSDAVATATKSNTSANTNTSANANEKSAEAKFIKVDASKLDRLIDLVGELVIASASAQLAAYATGASSAHETSETVCGLVEQIRDSALNMRMVPVGEVFQRFPRVVRDVAKELGKQIELEIHGADTELDKSMVEMLVDPLMHCVRNALDHGIERVDERRAAGKPDTGKLRLTAYQESGSIVIEIADDGRGMDPARIRNKAIERELITADAVLSHNDILNLIFAPGFSTAEQITNISGRGVGMDVVRKNIEMLRGSIELQSEFGKGSLVRIRLPLTMAIIDGFRVQAGRSDFVIPLELIQECVDLNHEDMHHNLIRLRGESLPVVSLRTLFGLQGSAPTRENLVVVQFGATRAGIVVDRLVGELQAVIKPLAEIFQNTSSISGSTILGNGDVALLLDIPQLVQAAQTQTLH